MTELRVAVVGMGIGQSHLLSWREVDGATATVFAELDDAKRAKGEVDWGIPGVASLDVLLDPASPHEVDVIDLCTPPSMHEEQVTRCLDAGKHVICEKPLVDSVAACDRLAIAVDRAAATSGARFMPIFQYRFGEGAARARALIDAGITGRLFTASASTWWRRGKGYYAAAPWRGTWAGERGGCVLSHAIHNHDMLMWMAGPFVELRAMATTRVNDVQTEDCAVAIGRTADGALVTMNVTLGAASEFVATRVALRQRHDHVVDRGVRPRRRAVELRVPTVGLRRGGRAGVGRHGAVGHAVHRAVPGLRRRARRRR